MAKRLFDLLVASLALLVLAPLMLGLALWIKVDSPGPALFRQTRVGQGGRLFQILKFRSMRVAQAGHGASELTVGQDARITRAGRHLRRLRLDELPQLFNVLAGHMSLVGPRPEVPQYVAHYPPALREKALAVRPGLTDPASLAHLDEAQILAKAVDPQQTYIQHILPAKLEQAVRYAQQASLSSDIQVLWRTLRSLWWPRA